MIFVPLLHYFKCKNSYSGNEYGLRYRMIPGKRTVPDPNGGEGAAKEESILTVDYWPDPWTIEKTDPALRVQKVFPPPFCRTLSMRSRSAGRTVPA